MAYKYLLLDSQGNAIGHGATQQRPTEKVWRLQVGGRDIDTVMRHTNITLVSAAANTPGLEARIIGRKGDQVELELVRTLDEDVRKNLRIPVRFVSYLYPVSGSWKGRVPIVSKDLSCGGLAFYCPRTLDAGETVEVVVPVTAQPLVLPLQILRMRTCPDGETFYAGCFLDLVREEENMVREAVFSLQIQNN